MVYAVQFLETAVEELAELPEQTQRHILKRIEGLKTVPRPIGVKQLKGPEKFLRLRVGDYRLIYLIEGKHLVVLVGVEVLTRRVKAWRQSRTKI
jgi:mRNA interferase RelE/StbE